MNRRSPHQRSAILIQRRRML